MKPHLLVMLYTPAYLVFEFESVLIKLCFGVLSDFIAIPVSGDGRSLIHLG
ncbi:hypothetical protein RchiOBHm_Chr1g0352241 [Rosa chinensis]|uniref:Uncharacterized protein n=1 Tax=Rosa chinensis TaxID=74649 RepID=A0A2P6SGP3_ROSCH|nr:hypothetical protein RchiOBHm_Chr1g0352241 [Rosa chinensis]